MKWYVAEVQDNAYTFNPLKGEKYRLLVNERWEIKTEQRSTDEIINAAVAKFPEAYCRYTSIYFHNFREAWLRTLHQGVLRHLGLKESDLRGLSIDVVAEIRI